MIISVQEYQSRAHTTSEMHEKGIAQTIANSVPGIDMSGSSLELAMRVQYVTLGLVGEAGEIANKVKKIIRDNGGVITDDIRMQLAKELGDVAWYLAETCTVLGLDLATVLKMNLQKLAERKQAGTLHGSGDAR